MLYDLSLISSFCTELGVAHKRTDRFLEIELGRGVVLIFQNHVQDNDCAVFFKGTAWHTHGDFIFVGPEGRYLEVNYLDAIQGLIEGAVLVCDLWTEGKFVDRWVTHCKYNDEFKSLQPGEEVRVWRPTFGDLRARQAIP